MGGNKKNTTSKIIKSYLSYLSSIKGYSKGTIAAYETDLILFFRFLKVQYGIVDENVPFCEISISDIDKDFLRKIDLSDLYSFLSYLENDRGNADKTRARKIACLKSFFKFLYRKAKLIDHNVAEELETPNIAFKMPVYLNEHQSRQLLKNISGRNAVRDTCIITLFLNTGMRLSELCSIDIDNILGDTIVIQGKGKKERFVYLNNACMKAINKYIPIRNEKLKYQDVPCDALFISERKQRISKRAVEDVVTKAIKKAGLPNTFTVHKLRHTAATLLYKAGVDIRSLQTILGHNNVSTTQIYTHIEEDELRSAVKKNPLNL